MKRALMPRGPFSRVFSANATSGSLVLALSLAASGARADDAADHSAAAQALFDEGKKLVAEGDHAAACPKFEESERLDSKLGTQLNIALCYDATGRVASAWTLFRQVEVVAARAGDDKRAAFAKLRAEALVARLPHLTVHAPPGAAVAPIAITRDGAPVGAAQIDVAIPVDLGRHVVEAHAPDRQPWSTVVEVTRDGQAAEVTIPRLEPVPAAIVARPPPMPDVPPALPDAPPPSSSTQRTAGLVVGGAGLAALGAGLVFGAASWKLHGDSQDGCTANGCSDAARATRDTAITDGKIATWLSVAGGAAIAAGAVLWLTAPAPRRARVGLAPALGPSRAGVFATIEIE